MNVWIHHAGWPFRPSDRPTVGAVVVVVVSRQSSVSTAVAGPGIWIYSHSTLTVLIIPALVAESGTAPSAQLVRRDNTRENKRSRWSQFEAKKQFGVAKSKQRHEPTAKFPGSPRHKPRWGRSSPPNQPRPLLTAASPSAVLSDLPTPAMLTWLGAKDARLAYRLLALVVSCHGLEGK